MRKEKRKKKFSQIRVYKRRKKISFSRQISSLCHFLFSVTPSIENKHYPYNNILKMQFQNLVALFASVAAVQAVSNSTVVGGSNSTAVGASNGTVAGGHNGTGAAAGASNSSGGAHSKISTGGANSNALNAGMFGAAVAAGVAFLF
ncbi:ZYRO0F18106p [Zygosaccharomyces rouxii]|uniref:ZYRO0F18106p n=1 Tax=Zygosaccharomyces rouxii (strain ATCC 2623 / CBS 732 / NBRC 1130 / NCYC 568 / NRRL Y-229) TaxID=559307 RepID=C5DZ45_ZYGRC|nr:uncharacterized protein ZYRO0F18106g [Zygosaccharomyces rouxii]CAR29056.1 ZYRO0F18106p [Zygosaccharomyces rouxii]